VYTSTPALCVHWLPPPGMGVKYPTISHYREMKWHNISISGLGYDMNPTLQMLKLYVTVIYCNMPHKLSLRLEWKPGFRVCWVYDTTCTMPPAAHRPPLQRPSATACRHHSRRRRCITQRPLTTTTWSAGQLLPAVVLNVALIALPLITLGETPFVDVAHGI